VIRCLVERDRIRMGFTVGQIAWRLGITPAEYQRIVAGERSCGTPCGQPCFGAFSSGAGWRADVVLGHP